MHTVWVLGAVNYNLLTKCCWSYIYTATLNSRMGIDCNGNVGIWTANPSSKLHIDSGNIQISIVNGWLFQ